MKKQLYALSIASLMFLSGCKWFSCCSHDHSNPCTPGHTASSSQGHVTIIDNDKNTFAHTVLQAAKPVVVDVGAPWCGGCREIKPKFHKLAADATFKDTIVFAEINVDDHSAIAEQYKIQGIPAILFFHNGKEVAKRIEGDTSEAALKAAIADAFKGIK